MGHRLRKSVRKSIDKLADAVLQLPQASFDTSHFFADGMYLRMLPRKAGTLIIGKVHKKEHFYIVMSGRVSITNGDDVARIVEAPAVIVSPVGAQRAVYALEDSVCATVHRTEEKELEKVEADLVHPAPKSPYLTGNALPTELIEWPI